MKPGGSLPSDHRSRQADQRSAPKWQRKEGQGTNPTNGPATQREPWAKLKQRWQIVASNFMGSLHFKILFAGTRTCLRARLWQADEGTYQDPPAATSAHLDLA